MRSSGSVFLRPFARVDVCAHVFCVWDWELMLEHLGCVDSEEPGQ